jgi:hypothetical protein
MMRCQHCEEEKSDVGWRTTAPGGTVKGQQDDPSEHVSLERVLLCDDCYGELRNPDSETSRWFQEKRRLGFAGR